jgi:hypothetical protein
MFPRRRKLELESLECRHVPSVTGLADGLLATSDIGLVSDLSSSVPVIDPTEDPVNSGDTTLQATVTAVNTNGDLVESITVQGLSSANIQPFSTISFTVGDTTYLVDLVVPQDDGQYTLVVLAGINPAGLEVGSQVSLVIGNGGNSGGSTLEPATEEPPADAPPVIPIIDPTGDPTGE